MTATLTASSLAAGARPMTATTPTPPAAAGAGELDALKTRERELLTAINSTPGWGAAVGAMMEELRGIRRSIQALEADQAAAALAAARAGRADIIYHAANCMDGQTTVSVFELRQWAAALAAHATPSAVPAGWKLVPEDDASRELSDSALPSVMIWDGIEECDRLREAGQRGEIDLDTGMLVVGIFRAMVAAASTFAAPPAPAPSGAHATPSAGEDDAEKYAEESYQIGKRDGFEEAVQQIAWRVGHDGEYRVSPDPERHCPDPATMIDQIVELFDAAPPAPTPSAASATPSAGESAVSPAAIEAMAEHLLEEDHEPGLTWPTHREDDGYRGGGYVTIAPPDVQAHLRDKARRVLIRAAQISSDPRLAAAPPAPAPSGGAKHTDRSVPCPTCGFRVKPSRPAEFRVDDDEAAPSPDPRGGAEAAGDLAGLLEALQPFATCCDNHFHDASILDTFDADQSVLHLVRDGKLSPTGVSVGDLRRARDLVASATPAPPRPEPDLAGQGEPVAWAYEWREQGDLWFKRLSEEKPEQESGTRNIRPLYDRPAPAAPRPALDRETVAGLSAREILAQEYERHVGEGPYPTYAKLAREGSGSFTLCSIRAVERALAAPPRTATPYTLKPYGEGTVLWAGDGQLYISCADPTTVQRYLTLIGAPPAKGGE